MLQLWNINVLLRIYVTPKSEILPRLIYHLSAIKRRSCLSRGMQRWKDWRGGKGRESFCFWKFVAVSFWSKRVSAAQRRTAGELKASLCSALIGNMKGAKLLKASECLRMWWEPVILGWLGIWWPSWWWALAKITAATSKEMSSFFFFSSLRHIHT